MVTPGVLHDGVLSDLLSEALGVGWDSQHTPSRMSKCEIAGVPDSKMSPGCSVMVRAISATR